jgi:YHS domain-containing protein
MATAIDPVCGMEVETEGATLTYEYEGKTYYFCARGCLLDFKDEPGRYVSEGPATASHDQGASH